MVTELLIQLWVKGSQSLTISALPDGAHTIYAKVNKSNATSRTKTLAESTVTRAPITNADAFETISLCKTRPPRHLHN